MSDTRERARELCSCLGLTRLTEESEWIVDNITADGITAFAESEAALARKQEREACKEVALERCRVLNADASFASRKGNYESRERYESMARTAEGIATLIHERNLAETERNGNGDSKTNSSLAG